MGTAELAAFLTDEDVDVIAGMVLTFAVDAGWPPPKFPRKARHA
jgi:hypothetical protein